MSSGVLAVTAVSHSETPVSPDPSFSPTSGGGSGSGSAPLAFHGLAYAGAFSASLPLLAPDGINMKALRDDLLEEVKDVLIPADTLTVHYGQVIGKGTFLDPHPVQICAPDTVHLLML